MRGKFLLLMSMGIAILLVTSSLALYYRNQAVYFQRQWNRTSAQLAKASAKPVLQPSAVEVRPNTRPALTNTVNEDSAGDESRELERQPPEKNKPESPSSTTVSRRASDSESPRRRGWDRMENLENLRTTDPQRYEEIQQRRRQMQEYVQNAWDQRAEYFGNRDTSQMTESDMEEYKQFVALLDQTRSLTLQLQNDLQPDERRQVMSDVRSNMVVLAPLLDNERNRELYDLAVAMGHNESDAASFVDYVNQISSNTSLRSIFPRIRGGGPRGNVPPSAPPAR